jgi:hypothetical protein
MRFRFDLMQQRRIQQKLNALLLRRGSLGILPAAAIEQMALASSDPVDRLAWFFKFLMLELKLHAVHLDVFRAMSDIGPPSSTLTTNRSSIRSSLLVVLAFLISAILVAVVNGNAVTYHFAAVIALPMAAALSFLLVFLMPNIYGPFEFQFKGVTFKGGFIPLILWIICFVVIVLAIRLLW